MIKQQLTQKQQQKLSPIQIQQIKMLELSSLEIENRINQELEENPALEEETPENFASETESDAYNDPDDSKTDNDLSLGDYLTDDDVPDYALNHPHNPRENRNEALYSESESFQQYLLDQLHEKDLTDQKIRIGEYIIGNIDSDGYLRREAESLADDLAFQYAMDVSVTEIQEMTKLVQEFDPAGIGASDVRECLLLQLQRKERLPERELAIAILEKHFDAFSKKQYDKIVRSMAGVSDVDLKKAVKEIVLLNPKPGSSWESQLETKMLHVVPDFIVETSNGEVFFHLPGENIPELRVSREYSEILRTYGQTSGKETASERDAVAFVKQKIDSARWFIEAIKQRNTTLRQTMQAILEIQRDFFLTGEESDLKPMKLRDVSALCNYDISTISRVSNSKYVQTAWGVFPLRFFFSEGITNEEGEEVSIRKIKNLLRSFVEKEDKTKPLTDDALMIRLKEKGYEIARRTIAKYREQLNIPVARLRKEIV
jgi:RNA polymerase sigma-54 factor